MTRVGLGLLVLLLSLLGGWWALHWGTKDDRGPADRLGDVEQDWAALVADPREETA